MRWSERYVNPHLPIYSFTSHVLITIRCFVCQHVYSCFVEKFICTLCLDSTDKWCHMIYVFLFCLLLIEKLKSPRPQWHTRERLKHLLVRTKEPQTQRLIHISEFFFKNIFSFDCIRSHDFMANKWGNSGKSNRLYFLGSEITVDGDHSHEIQTRLLTRRKWWQT